MLDAIQQVKRFENESENNPRDENRSNLDANESIRSNSRVRK
jgi:hypothetical protein